MRDRILAVLAIMSLGGCTWLYDGKPVVAKYDPPPEYKFKSITHWKIVADDVASQTLDSLSPPPVDQNPVVNGSGPQNLNIAPNPIQRKPFDRPIYVNVTANSKFGKVFSSQLKSALLAKGFSLSATQQGALPINFRVEVVTQGPVDVGYIPGTLTAVTGGVLAIRNAAQYPSSGSLYATTFGIAGFVDLAALWREINKRPHTEIAVTISALEGSRYRIHTTDTYYIDTIDSDLYEGYYGPEISDSKPIDKSKTYNVIGGGSR